MWRSSNRHGWIAMAVAVLCLRGGFVWGVPLTLNYEGHLVYQGVAVEGSFAFKFALVNDRSESVWSHDGSSVAGGEPASFTLLEVSRGAYSARLGDTTVTNMLPLTAAVFDHESLWLRVWVGLGAEFVLLQPDQRLGSVAFAVRAESARRADIATTVTSLPEGLIQERHLPTNLLTVITGAGPQITVTSNALSARVLATNTALTGALNAETSARIAAIAQAIVDLLAATNQWIGSNSHSGVVTATNFANVFSGTFAGSGAGLNNLSATSVNGTLVAANIPDLDAAKITGGTLADGRLGTNIARMTDVAAVEAKIGTGGQPVNVVTVSTDPADPALTGLGYVNFMKVPASPWSSGTVAGSPTASFGLSSVWTGSRMIVWGGDVGGGNYSGSGGLYDPGADTWGIVSPVDAPTARRGQSAVWTGSEMLIWGGFNAGGELNTGGRFNPAQQIWRPITTNNAPVGRLQQVAAWTGSEMVIWSGHDGGVPLGDGARYNPTNDTWVPISLTNAPGPRFGSGGVWTGSRLLVFGGLGEFGELNDGGGYDPVNNTWTSLTVSNAPSARTSHSAVWTGSRLIVWGGIANGVFRGDGASYDPGANAWSSLNPTNAPAARHGHHAFWTGSEMLIWGGTSATGTVADGAAYQPATDSWRSLNGAGAPLTRRDGTAVFTGNELLIHGGRNDTGQTLTSLQRLNPQPDFYFYRKP